MRLWRSADRFDPQRGSVRGFLFTIARRRAVDLMRRPSSRPLDPPSEPGGALDQSFDRALLEVSVREAMTALSEEHRQVLELVYDEDLSQRQIAERVGVPLGTVKTRTFYALRALKGVLDDRGMHA